MKQRKWTSRLACALLVTAVIGGVAFATGTQGSQEDPLVTLSYLTEKVLPDILKQVDDKISEREKVINERLAENDGNTFATVELKAKKTMTLSSGTQVLVRQGGLTTDAALLDVTEGSAHPGGELIANHLYMATGDKQALTAVTAVTVMVLGEWK